MRKALIIACLVVLVVMFVYASDNVDNQLQTQPQTKPSRNYHKVEKNRKLSFTERYIDSEYFLVKADYVVEKSFYIGAVGKLYVEPGTRFYFSEHSGIICEGSIEAIGTKKEPIEFDALGSAKWENIFMGGLLENKSKFKYCKFQNSSGKRLNLSQALNYLNKDQREYSGFRTGALTIFNTSVSFENCEFHNCVADKGSAIFACNSDVQFNKCNFKDNKTSEGALFISSSKCKIDKCEISNNYSIKKGAGITCDSYSLMNKPKFKTKVIVSKTSFRNNESEMHGGAISQESESVLIVKDSEFINNKCGKEKWGGAIFSDEASLKLENTSFIGNSALYGGAVMAHVHNGYTDWMNLTINNCTFKHNKAKSGGAISNAKIPMSIEDSSFIENYAKEDGGAIVFWEFSTFEIFDSVFRRNKSKNGGAICSQASSLRDCKIVDTEFIENEATEKGGGMLLESESDFIDFVDCTLKRNTPDDIDYLYRKKKD